MRGTNIVFSTSPPLPRFSGVAKIWPPNTWN
jgi:hypothetical protein